MSSQVRIAILGAGNMGTACARGLRHAAAGRRSEIVLASRDRVKTKRLATALGVTYAPSNRDAAARADVIILAIKPQILPDVLGEIRSSVRPGTTILSIAAGVPTSVIESSFTTPIGVIRAMPNVAAAVRASATAYCRGHFASGIDVRRARSVLECLGTIVEVDERSMDAVTGLSGTGPLYVFLILEALSDAGVKVGLSRAIASHLAMQTLTGAAQLMEETGEHPAKLRELVTSPAGTAITALHSLERSGLKATLLDAVEAATDRATALGRQWEGGGNRLPLKRDP